MYGLPRNSARAFHGFNGVQTWSRALQENDVETEHHGAGSISLCEFHVILFHVNLKKSDNNSTWLKSNIVQLSAIMLCFKVLSINKMHTQSAATLYKSNPL